MIIEARLFLLRCVKVVGLSLNVKITEKHSSYKGCSHVLGRALEGRQWKRCNGRKME